MSSALKSATLKRSEKTKDKLLVKLLDSLICSICHDYMFVPVMTQCGHNYCYECLTSWFESNSNELSCPQCRTSISETPGLNSAMQQWLGMLIESSNHKDGKELQEILQAKESSEKSYKFDKNNDSMFNGIFKTSAMGVVDEDDDGILRCSNCHWELEDDVGDICPHCNSRIRSRMSQSRQHPNEDEGDEGDEDDYSEADNDEELLDELKISLERYQSAVRRNVAKLERDQDELHTGFLVRSETEGGDSIYSSSYSLYVASDWTLHESERIRRARLVQDLECGRSRGRQHSRSSTPVEYEEDRYAGTDISDDMEILYDDEEEEQSDHSAPMGIVDLEAEVEDISEQELQDSSHDSDYYEQNDGGFVSGDSLDDEPVEQELEHSGNLAENSGESQELQHSPQPSSRKRKRFQVVVDSDDEES